MRSLPARRRKQFALCSPHVFQMHTPANHASNPFKSNRLARVLRCVKLQKLLCIDKTSEKTTQKAFWQCSVNPFATRLLGATTSDCHGCSWVAPFNWKDTSAFRMLTSRNKSWRAWWHQGWHVARAVAGFGEISWLDWKVHRCWNHPINGAVFFYVFLVWQTDA